MLGPQFERATKHKVTTTFDLAGVLKTRIEGGEPFDVAILTAPLVDELISKGRSRQPPGQRWRASASA